MGLTKIFHLCEFFKVDYTVVLTVIGLVDGLLFLLGATGRSYMDVAPLSGMPKLLPLFSIFVVRSIILSKVVVF